MEAELQFWGRGCSLDDALRIDVCKIMMYIASSGASGGVMFIFQEAFLISLFLCCFTLDIKGGSEQSRKVSLFC